MVTTDSGVVVVSPRADGVRLTATPTSTGGEEYVGRIHRRGSGFRRRARPEQPRTGSTSWCWPWPDPTAPGWWPARCGSLPTTWPDRHQFGRPLSTFQTVAAQLAEVYIASRTLDLASTSVVWRLSEGLDADDDLDVLGYWLTSQAPPAMQTCHHLHGGMGVDVTYPMHRYYSSIKDLTRLLGGPAHRLDLVGAQCTSN